MLNDACLPGMLFGPSNLVDLLRHRAHYQPDDVGFTFLVDGESQESQLTYQELERRARAIAAWLGSMELPGQRALLLYPPGLDFIEAFFGCLFARVVAVPIYPPRNNRSLERIQTIAEDAEARVVLTTEAVLDRAAPLVEQTPGLRQMKWQMTSHIPEGIEQQWTPPEIGGDTLAFLQYTSGSTGSPKGVMLTHTNLMHNSAVIANVFEHTRSCRGVFWLPAHHDMGLIGGILQPLYVGRPNVIMSPVAFLQKPYRWLAAISRYGGTTSGGPNFAYDLCVRKIPPEVRRTLDLSTWTVAFNGAEPVLDDTLDRFAEAFEPCGFRREAFFPCYGLAEASLMVSGGFVEQPPVIGNFQGGALKCGRVVETAPGGSDVRRLVGCGRGTPDQEVIVIDPQTQTRCPPDRVGEIWVRGPSVAQGYWRKPDVTQNTFFACLQDSGEGPFLRTGDLGFLYQGELFVAGRIKDMIIVRGLNHYPQDVEHTIEKAHPSLRPDCGAVFTVEEGDRQQLIAVQEVDRHTNEGFAEIFAAIRRSVTDKHGLSLDRIILVKASSIAKTSSGKIQRYACRSDYLAGTLRVVSQWQLDESQDSIESPGAENAEPAVFSPQPVADAGKKSNGKAFSMAPPTPASRRVHDRSGTVSPVSGAAEAVLEEVRRCGRQRAAGVTIDSDVADAGLDSLERMEILASLEDRFGGRFPEEVLPDLQTWRQVVEAVEKYLGRRPLATPDGEPIAEVEIPTAFYRVAEFPEVAVLRQTLESAKAAGLDNPYFQIHDGTLDNRARIGGRNLINFSTFNYLGMAADPAVVQAVKDACDRYGASACASRLVSGETQLHQDLEQAIARFLGVEDALTFVAGHSTNESVIGHLMGPDDLILHDSLAHNSILQGAILSRARRRPFAHNDWQTAARLLGQIRRDYRRVLMVIEGVYSMDGDFPDLPKFIEVKRRYKALLMIDEAHSIGVLGATGHGIGEHYNVDRNDVDIWMGTMSKALGSSGGYIAGGKELIEHLRYTAPSFVFAVGISPPTCAAALAAIRLLEAHPERVERLRQGAQLFLTLARQRGLNTGASHGTPIVPVILGNSMLSLKMATAMRDRGVNVQPILYPAVEESAARLRFFVHAQHTDDEIRYTVDATAEELQRLRAEFPAEGASPQPDMFAALARARQSALVRES